MSRNDLKKLVTPRASGINDRKVACETLADDDPPRNDIINEGDAAAGNLPPESFWLSKDAEYDWFDHNAFYERKDSTKGNSNSTNLNPHINPRFSVNLKSKASIIGLPKTQKTSFVDTKRRVCKPTNIRLFPKRPESVGKSTTAQFEPGSPKVSCIGRVRSRRSRRRSNSRKRSEEPAVTGKQKPGFYSKVLGMFRGKKSRTKPFRSGSRKVVAEPVVVRQLLKNKSLTVRVREISFSDEPVAETPCLEGMKRFTSGRRSGSWTSEDFNQAVSGDLDRCVDDRVENRMVRVEKSTVVVENKRN